MARISKKRRKELESENTKYCTNCKKVKPLFEFRIQATGRKFAQAYCIECERKRTKERNTQKFGITLEDYDKIFKEQDNKCAICGTKEIGNKRHGRFSIDHDHSTNKIRGLLCHNCNILLGVSKDDIKILAKAIQYLIESRK